MINFKQVEQKILEIINEISESEEEIGEEDIHLGLDEVGVDSLMSLEVAVTIEREFDCDVDESNLEKIKTVRDLIDIVYEKVNAG